MTVMNHPVVGTGAASSWDRPTNKYADCSCPPWRYSPRYPAPVSTGCPEHGAKMTGPGE